AYRAGKEGGARGIFGNAQTHCMQLPNTFAFARASQGLPAEREDYLTFADGLISGQGALIVSAWELLAGTNHKTIPQTIRRLQSVKEGVFATGELRGLLFGDGRRFLGDLVDQLRVT